MLFVIYYKKFDFSEYLTQLPCEQSRYLLDLTDLTCLNQTKVSSSGEKTNMLGMAKKSLKAGEAQSRMSKSIGAI